MSAIGTKRTRIRLRLMSSSERYHNSSSTSGVRDGVIVRAKIASTGTTASDHRTAITLEHLPPGLVVVTPKAQIEILLPDLKINKCEVGQPCR